MADHDDTAGSGETTLSNDAGLKQLAKELQRSAADAHIEPDTRYVVAVDESEAKSKADQRAAEYGGKVEPTADGP